MKCHGKNDKNKWVASFVFQHDEKIWHQFLLPFTSAQKKRVLKTFVPPETNNLTITKDLT